MFDQVGEIVYSPDTAGADEMFEAALEAGAQDVTSDAKGHTVVCEPEDFGQVADSLQARFGSPESAGLTWKPQTTIEVDYNTARTPITLSDVLEDHGDGQRLSANLRSEERSVGTEWVRWGRSRGWWWQK